MERAQAQNRNSNYVSSSSRELETQRDRLVNFIDAARAVSNEFNDPCKTAKTVLIMGDGLSLWEMETPLDSRNFRSAEIQKLAKEAKNIIEMAKASNCVAVNDLCCKRAATAEVSDACNANTGTNCTLRGGPHITGCTTVSDECPQ